MQTIKKLVVLAIAVSSLAACSKTSYKKTKGGMPYKLFPGKDTQKVMPGSYVKLNVTQKINDSVTMSTATGIPIYLFISNQQQQGYDISELWTSLHVGDSLVTVQMM